jgi:hypothetical protein
MEPERLSAQEAYREAIKVTGTDLLSNAQWFLKFGQRDLSKFTSYELLQLWNQMLAICILATRQPGKSASAKTLTTAERQHWERAANWPRFPWNPKQTPEQSEEYEAWLQHVLGIGEIVGKTNEQATTGQPVAMPMKEIVLVPSPKGPRPTFPLTSFRTSAEGTHFSGADGPMAVRLLQILQKYYGLIHRCPQCQDLFIARRKDQRFHDSGCRAMMGMRKKRRSARRPKSHRPGKD